MHNEPKKWRISVEKWIPLKKKKLKNSKRNFRIKNIINVKKIAIG